MFTLAEGGASTAMDTVECEESGAMFNVDIDETILLPSSRLLLASICSIRLEIDQSIKSQHFDQSKPKIDGKVACNTETIAVN